MPAKSALQQATRKVTRALSGVDSPADEIDVLTTLKKEHDEVKELLSDLQDAKGSAERKSLVSKIKAALIPHTKAEEKVVYDAIISSADDQAETDGLEGYLEHELASRTLEKLAKLQATSAEHRATAKVLKELVEHHIQEEESSVWKDVRQHFDKDARMRMNAAFEAAKKRIKPS